MHSRPMDDSEGQFTDMRSCEGKCHKCGKIGISYREWVSKCGGIKIINIHVMLVVIVGG